MENLLNILGKVGFDWQVALANLFNFLIIFFILKKFAFGPIGKLIKERQDAISKGLSDADKNKKLLDNTQKEYEKVLLAARSEANQLIVDAKKDAQDKKDQLLEQARKEVAIVLDSGKKALEVEKVKIVEEARKEIVDIVMRVSEKVLGEKVDANYNSKIVKELNNL